MTSRSMVNDLVSMAFEMAGDLPDKVTYKRFTGKTYDVTTDKETPTYDPITNVTAVPTTIEEDQEGLFPLEPEDRLYAIADNDLGNIEPSVNDVMEISGVEWDIIRVHGIVGRSLWKFQIRKR